MLASDELIVQRAAKLYGLQSQQILPPQKGYRNSSYPIELANGAWVNLIIYKSEPGIVATIRRTNAVSEYLARQSLPVRSPYDLRVLKLVSHTRTRYAALYHYLPGETIPWEGYTKDHIKLLGMMMGRLHATLKNYPSQLPLVVDEYTAIISRMAQYFMDEQVRQAVQQKLGVGIQVDFEWFSALLTACRNLPSQHALHMDMVRGNVLFRAAKDGDEYAVGDIAMSGILDFEKVRYGHPLFDIARTLAFLLVDCKYKSADGVRKYFLFSGYDKRGTMRLPRITLRLTSGPTDLLDGLTKLFLLHDFYKFLRHNPYEYLYQNEHYCRTKQLLFQQGLLVENQR